MAFVPRSTAVLVALPLGLAILGACDAWPLYTHLPDPDLLPMEPDRIVFAEDGGEEGFQELTLPGAPLLVTVSGRVESCGWDGTDTSYPWPVESVDSDGDAVADTPSQFSGWYSGDVDRYSWESSEALAIRASLSWAEAPAEGANSPYRPAEVDGTWTQESDLDLVVVSVGAAGELVAILNDGGVSLAHPESLPAALSQPAAERIGLVVACHHGQPSDYTLSLEFSAL